MRKWWARSGLSVAGSRPSKTKDSRCGNACRTAPCSPESSRRAAASALLRESHLQEFESEYGSDQRRRSVARERQGQNVRIWASTSCGLKFARTCCPHWGTKTCRRPRSLLTAENFQLTAVVSWEKGVYKLKSLVGELISASTLSLATLQNRYQSRSWLPL